MVNWTAKIEIVHEEYNNDLKILSIESEKHKTILSKWMEIFGIEEPKDAPKGLPSKTFDFSGMDPARMFEEIRKYEYLVKDTYMDIINCNDEILKQLKLDQKQINDFKNEISSIVEDEERHINICDKNVGGFSTIHS